MKKNFVIWTMRRTGGTSLANAIARIGDYPIEHEPFNWDRIFGEISRGFNNDKKNYDFLSDQIKEKCFDKGICVKHCYEVAGNVLNPSLVELFSKANYKHIFWYRKNDLMRLLSLFTAKQTDVWGKHGSKDAYKRYLSGDLELTPYNIEDMNSHFQLCKRTSRLIKQTLLQQGCDFKELSYEDLYAGELADREKKLTDLCLWLGIEPGVIKETLKDCKFNLMNANQNSAVLYKHIPNLNEIKEAFPDFRVEEK